MSPRARVLAFGTAGAVSVAGGLCALLFNGLTGEILAITLLLLGLGGALLLLFYEVGLSEDRERAETQERRRRRAAELSDAHRRARLPRRPRRPG